MRKTLKEKLIEYLEYKGYKKSNVQELAGVPKTLFSGEKAMNQGLSEVVLLRIVHAFPDLDLYWFLKGEGDMIRKQTDTHSDLTAFCPGSKSGQIV